MNCAQIKEQLVDYLYGELEEEARAAFAEHLRACSGCSAEVASHERALGHTRAALTGPLSQEPPARVRLAVLEAARTQAKMAKQSRAEQPGFFARLWRTPWLVPAFGAASVATVVFLVRVLKDPEVVPGQRRTTIAENAPAASAPEAPPPPAPVLPGLGPQAAAPPDEELTKPLAHREQRADSGKMGARKGSGAGLKAQATSRAPSFESFGGFEKPRASGGRFVEPPPTRGATKADQDVDDLSASLKDRNFAAPAPEEPAPRARKAAPGRDETREYGRPPVPLAEKKASAPEPARRPASQPSAAAAPPPPAPAPAYAPPPQTTRHGDKRKAEAEEAAWDSAPLEGLAKAAPTAGKSGSSLDESVKKADRLFAAQDWAPAAIAYRDLLDRYPNHKDAAKWRGRMNQALAAADQARAAKARAGAAANPFGGGNP